MKRRLFFILLLVALGLFVFSNLKLKDGVNQASPISQEGVSSEPLGEISVSTKKVNVQDTSQEKREKNISLTEFELLLKKDDVCSVIEHFSKFSVYDLFQLLLSNPEVYPVKADIRDALTELLTGKGPFEGFVIQNPRTNTARFYNALVLARLMDNVTSEKADYQEARNILQDLKRNDSGNSAYSYFLTEVLLELNEPKDKIREEILSVQATDRFDVFSKDIEKAFIEKGFVNSSYFYLAYHLNSFIKGPDFFGPQALIAQYYKKDDFEISNAIFKLSQDMTRDTMAANGTLENYNWIVAQYTAGLSLFKLIDTDYDKSYWLSPHDMVKEGFKVSGQEGLLELKKNIEKGTCSQDKYRSFYEGFLKMYNKHLQK